MELYPVTFGKCPRCGANGGDYPAADISDADSDSNLEVVGNGVKLELFRGDWLCPMCVKEIKQDEESRKHAKKHADAERFRGRAGFSNSV